MVLGHLKMGLSLIDLLICDLEIKAATSLNQYMHRSRVIEEVLFKVDSLTTKSIDEIQSTHSCCGALIFTEWRETSLWYVTASKRNVVPDSCCKTQSPECGRRDHPSNIYYTVSKQKQVKWEILTSIVVNFFRDAFIGWKWNWTCIWASFGKFVRFAWGSSSSVFCTHYASSVNWEKRKKSE